jgi:two-component system sensor kinase
VFGDRYRAFRLLKKGNGVETWLGTDLVRRDTVVIKTASSDGLAPGAQLRLEHEASVLRDLHIPWCAPLLDLGREQDLLYLVMPFIAGVPLSNHLSRGPLSVRDTVTVGRCLFSALQEVHEQGVLHRDLKPANVIVDEETPFARAILIDFGLARGTRLDSSLRNLPVGTVRYVSPEQAGLLGHAIDERSDLYSAGVVLFECLAGQPPFQGEDVGEVLRQHMTVRPPELRSRKVRVPRALDELVQRLLRKDPGDRYQSAEAVLADLFLIADALDAGQAEPPLVVGLRDRRRTLTQPAFVGRYRELAALEIQLERAGEGEGGLVFLEAESGGGKSRLLEELAQRGAHQGFWVLRGQGVEQTAQRPFQVLAGVANELSTAARTNGDLDPIRQRLGEQAKAVCAALPELAPTLGVQTTERLGPETFGQVRTLQALVSLLDALGSSEHPALVVLDDCQWADELALRLLSQWQRRGLFEPGVRRQVLVVVAFRSEEVAAGHFLRGLQPALHLRLPPFEAADVRRLAESMAGPLPEAVLTVVEQLSEGSPFLATAVLQGLFESGAMLPAEPTGWEVDSLALADVQSSRHAAAFLARRIDRLPPAVLSLLSAGAVLGREFDRNTAAMLAGQTPGEALAALEESHQRHLIWAYGPTRQAGPTSVGAACRAAPAGPARQAGPTVGAVCRAASEDSLVSCTFVHDKLRQTLLTRLTPSDRQALHGRAALYLEKGDPERVFHIAYHFDAAGDSKRALPYALAAAEQARARYSLEVAEQQYRIARRGSSEADSATRFQVAEGLGDVLMLRGQYEDAAGEFETALALAQGNVAQAQIEGKLGELAFKRGDVKTAGERIERALLLLGKQVPRSPLGFFLRCLQEVFVQVWHTLLPGLFLGRRSLEGAETERLALRLHSRLATLYWFHRGTVPALWAHLHEMNVAERYPPTPELAQAYSDHAPGMSLLGCFQRGIAYAEKSLAIRKALGDLWGQGQSLHFYGVVLYASSRFRECIDRCREAIRLFERTGDQWEVSIARYQIAASLYRLGDLRGAVAEAQQMYQAGLELGDPQASGISLDVWARASLGRVPPEIIRTELQRPSADVQRTAQVLLAEGVRLLYAGQPEQAATILAGAQERVQAAGIKNAWVASLLPWLATALRQQAEKTPLLATWHRRALLRRAQVVAHKARRLARRFQNELPHVLRESALLCALQGRFRRARRYFDKSLQVARRQDAGYEHAQTLLARGRVGLEIGWPGAEDQVRAGQHALSEIEQRVIRSRLSDGRAEGSSFLPADNEQRTPSEATLSLADRFDNVLEAGRRITSALTRDSIYAAVREGALKLLRGERCLLLKIRADEAGEDITTASGEVEGPFSRDLVQKALAAGRAIALVESESQPASESLLLTGVRSALCAPIFVRGRAVACFCVTHHQVGGLFGETEERLADFIATIAGAALENAEGFAELRRLNESLEQRIEERRQAEKQIQEQAALLDKAQDAICVLDLEDRIVYWNQSAARLFGWTAQEALGQKADALFMERGGWSMEGADPSGSGSTLRASPSALLQLAEARRATQETGEWAGELRQVTRAGREIIVESRWTLVRDDGGQVKSCLVVSTDITERKKLEAQFLRAQRMESLGKLAGGIAHDINNVLTPILMSIDLLRCNDLAEADRQNLLGNMEASAQRGGDMVQQILSFARGVEGQRVLLNVKHVLRDLEKMLHSTFPKSINLATNVPRDLWLVCGDSTQLYQMLMNLCVNARDAMPEGGTLTIAGCNRVLGDRDLCLHPDARPGPYVLLTVTDTGTGIPPEIVDQIFDPFFTTKEFGMGTGLGLSTVLGVVKGHGGFIQVASELGVGTSFQVHLPAAEMGQPRPVAESPAALPRGRGEGILVVDDESHVRDITKRQLEEHGYRVFTARDGNEALARYAQHQGEIHLVVTDVIMPGMDGRKTIKALRQLNPELRIIAVSGLPFNTEAAGPGTSGAQAVLQKPYSPHALLRAVQEVLAVPLPDEDSPLLT